MTDSSLTIHKTKHLLSHVLATAASRRWPEATRGESGETKTGFYADFALAGPPTEEELAALTDDMARLLFDFASFHELELTPEQALNELGAHPWKRRQIEAIAETDPLVRCVDLDGDIDVCDCALKDATELRAIHPEKFTLTAAHPVMWSHRGREELFFRLSGELFPTPAPCNCCHG